MQAYGADGSDARAARAQNWIMFESQLFLRDQEIRMEKRKKTKQVFQIDFMGFALISSFSRNSTCDEIAARLRALD